MLQIHQYGKGGAGDIPTRLTDYVEGRKGYDYRHHADKDADHLGFITEDIIDSFGVLGAPDVHVAKIRELQAAGATQFNVYLMCGEEERMVEEYGKHIIPQFS
jgi:alkanesulfonate monooxygenase SsuD/methylene tetrahydromethanopterin reductase-like flavin-dependent oxidoreductase (luciferase family)